MRLFAKTRSAPLGGAARRQVALIVGLALLVGLTSLASGIGSGLEQGMASLRFGLRHTAASGDVVIVEVDAESLQRFDRWPWPRALFARALDRLNAADARSIAFDIDFSSASSAGQDAAFAAALARTNRAVILPTFRQPAGSPAQGWIDSLPIAALRQSAFLAAVNVFPDPDGVVRTYPVAVVTNGVPRPSIASMLAERPGRSGDAFWVDYAIDPASVPRISFADLASGRVARAAIEGKRVLIGATAIELGDRYTSPRYGIIPGVVIQALATETLMRHGKPIAFDGGLFLAMAALLLIGVSGRRQKKRVAAAAACLVVMIAAPVAAEQYGMTVAIAPALLALATFMFGELYAGLQAELSRRRFIDRATTLPNRAAIEQSIAASSESLLVVARIDQFHEKTTALGQAGSALLIRQLADRIAHLLGITVYRIEDGAIGWIDPNLSAKADPEDHFVALGNVLREPVLVGESVIDARPTFGVAEIAAHAEEAVAGALIAAQNARARGTRWQRFIADDGQEQRRRIELLGRFTRALESGEVWVAYQPKFDLARGRIVGSEALVRWHHPARGAIPPDNFIPLIEEEGRAHELTAFVLRQSLTDLAGWRRMGHDVSVAVNLSATLLQDPQLVAMVREALDRSGVEPSRLTLELTESAIIADFKVASEKLAELKALGLRLSIDDYGTGQSTLSYLKHVPASELKIDKSFVQSIVEIANDRLLVRSTIELAHALDLKVVAEGVEDSACLDMLRDLGCDVIQGWLIGRPMPTEEFSALLDRSDMKAAA